MACTSTILAALAAVLATAYFFLASKFSYWKRRGVPFPKPSLIFGNTGSIMLGRKSFPMLTKELADRYPERGYCGMYTWAKPVLLVYDADMAKQILCKDFSSFHDRGIPYDVQRDPMSANLFALGGPQWRNLRAKLSPTFTSGKMKLMFPLMREVADELSACVVRKMEAAAEAAAKASTTAEVDLCALLTFYSTDVIGSCAFGMECHCLRDDRNDYVEMGRAVSRMSPGQILRNLLAVVHPKLANLVPMKWIIPKATAFFVKLMEDTVAFREKNQVERHDFVHLMMQLRQLDLAHHDPDNHIELTPSIMAANAFIFFLAGLDNVSNTVCYILSRLAVDTDLQDRAVRDVRDALRDHDGELSYAALKRMQLLDRLIQEGLRLWSPVDLLFRKCNATTRIGDLVVEEGVGVMIVGKALHYNPQHFPEPERFDPERHTAEAREARHPYAFLPFGEGPRFCIAERFALLEMKLALVVLLRDFSFAKGPSFEDVPKIDTKNFFPRPLNGFPLRVERRTTSA